jgi:RHS repeat-associated protein
MNITGKTTVLPPVSGGSGTSLTTDIQYGYSNPGTGIPSSVKQWDYYAAAPTSLPDSPPGLPTRETDTTLGYSVNGALFPTLVNYEDATGSVVSSTNYTYDETAYMSGAAPTTTPNHSDALVTGNRGNLTTITKCCAWNGTSNVPLTSHVWYDDAGTVTAIQDANGKKTSLTAYDPTDTFPTTITLPATGSVSHVIEQTFDQNSGQLSSVTDENGQTTSYTFDQLGRPFQVKFSNAGNSVTLQTTTYPSANETDVSVLQASGVFLTASSITDGYGRPAQSIQEGISVETTYDSQGRLYSVTNAHAGTPSSTDGTAYFSHDELGRINSVKMPNTYSTIYSYAQNSVLVTDPLQHSRQITADSFGDTISVLEPNGAGNLAIATSYQYNWQGRLTYVSQQGGSVDSTQWRNRTFQYDGVGRLISQTTPEAGTMSLGYDNNGNLTSTQNQNTTNNTTQYYYDALNRITSAAIGGGPTYTYTYDAQDNSGDPYGKGRMTSTTNGSNVQTEWQHDPLGRSVSSAYCLPSDCTFDYKVQSVFDYQGNMTSLTYPDGRQVQWSYDQLNRPVSEMYASWNSIPVNTPYVSNISYYPAGQLQQASLGNGVQLGATYDPDQNLSSLVYVANGSPIVQKTYAWDKNAANLTSINDLAAGRTQSYGYDQLDRISLMADTGTTSNACNANLPTMPPASQSYSIDPWGNLQQSGTFSFSQLIGQNNQVEGYQYDSAGNQKQDANGNSYQYRADGLMTGSNGSTYTYDALGQRVRKDGSSSNEYIYLGGQLLAMRNPSTGVWTDRVYGPTGPLATVPGTQTGAPSFRISDHLGSLSYTLDASGNITGASSVLPYGQQTINTTSDNFVFTDHERDPENGSDATLYRHYASTQGRWLSPDPSNGSYNLLDPQSLNRYAYLANRPMAKTDRLGLDDGDFSFNGSDGDNGDDGDDGDSGWDGFWDDVGDWFGFGGGSGGSGHGGSGNHGVASPGPTGGIPSISAAAGTTQPGAGSATISMSLYYNGSTGVITGSWSVIDYSPGLDQDGMAEVPLIGVSYNGGGGSGPSNGGSGTSNAPNNGTFTKKYLPPGAQSCSAIFNFHAPPGFDLNAIIAAGRAGGANPFAALRAVGHGGTFDFQRSISGGNTTFYSGYTDASNIAVGAYLYGAGFSNGQASFISNSFANTMSSNAGSPQQSDYRNLGYDLANAGWNPSCH